MNANNDNRNNQLESVAESTDQPVFLPSSNIVYPGNSFYGKMRQIISNEQQSPTANQEFINWVIHLNNLYEAECSKNHKVSSEEEDLKRQIQTSQAANTNTSEYIQLLLEEKTNLQNTSSEKLMEKDEKIEEIKIKLINSKAENMALERQNQNVLRQLTEKQKESDESNNREAKFLDELKEVKKENKSLKLRAEAAELELKRYRRFEKALHEQQGWKVFKESLDKLRAVRDKLEASGVDSNTQRGQTD